jgi:hypothetical protein
MPSKTQGGIPHSDRVRIVESRPYSKDKHWAVEEILQRVEQVDTTPLQADQQPA